MNWQDEIIKKTEGEPLAPIFSNPLEKLDRAFAEEAGLSYAEYKALDLLAQSELRRKITNKRLKAKKQ